MTQDREKIIERIKKLIALSEDSSTTEGERDNCRQKAKKLMLQYSIDALGEDLSEAEICTQQFKLEKTIFGLDTLNLCSIVGTVGPTFGCYSCFSHQTGSVFIMGFKVNCEIVDYTVRVLLNQGAKDCSSMWRQSPSANTKLAFWKGFIFGLKKRYVLKDALEETGIKLYDKVRQEFLARTQFVNHMILGSSGEAVQAGIKSAQEARVNAGLNSQSGTKNIA